MEVYENDDDKARRVAIELLVECAWQTVWGNPANSNVHGSANNRRIRYAAKLFGSLEQCETLKGGLGGTKYNTGKSYNNMGTWRWEVLGTKASELAEEILPLLERHGGHFQMEKARFIRLELGL